MIDALDWIAMTVKMEAEGEVFAGKLAVAFTIRNRMNQGKRSAEDVCLAPWQFSCWNTDSPTRSRLEVDMSLAVWSDSYRAAAAALYQLVPDPTRGATHYLNPDVLDHLPSWYNKTKVLVTIGHHDFLIA
jgi:N-acetylmuramoyl-L-alanine amidase